MGCAVQAMVRRERSEGNLLDGLHEKQLETCLDKSKRIADCWGRRAGKTTGILRRLLKGARDNPKDTSDDAIIPYVAPTKNQAKRLMWGALQYEAERRCLPFDFAGTDLIARHKNGCEIWIMGADDDRDVQRLRGFSYRAVEIDEAQAIGADFESLIDEVLEPALADFQGPLHLSGTPGAACIGYFYRASTGQLPGWSRHHGTILDNPYFPLWRGRADWQQLAGAWLNKYMTDKGWDEDHPTFKREWQGVWVTDEGGLVYKYVPARNDYTGELPDGYHWEYVMGTDFGHDDAFAIVVWAFSRDLPDVFEVDTFKKAGLTISDWGNLIRKREQQYKPLEEPADTGALGKAIVKEINQRFGTALTPAEKKDKFGNIELMNSDFRAGRIHVRKGSPLTQTWSILQWDESKKKEDPRFSNDDADAGLYGYRASKHWTYEEPEAIPARGTMDRANWEMQKDYEKEITAFQEQESRSWWEQ